MRKKYTIKNSNSIKKRHFTKPVNRGNSGYLSKSANHAKSTE